MIKRTKLLVAPLLSLSCSLGLAACGEDSSGSDTDTGAVSGSPSTTTSATGSAPGTGTMGAGSMTAGSGTGTSMTTGTGTGSGTTTNTGATGTSASPGAGGGANPTPPMTGGAGGGGTDDGSAVGDPGAGGGPGAGAGGGAGGGDGQVDEDPGGGMIDDSGATDDMSEADDTSEADDGGETDDGGEVAAPVDLSDCVLPDLPPVGELPRNEKLPDPFTFFDGTPVTTKAQWECRRREIQHMAATYIYGPYPFEPDETTGTVNGGEVTIVATEGGNSETFTASISGNGDVIRLNMGSGMLPQGKNLSFGGGFEGKISSLFGLSGQMNTNVATGWMVDRLIEVLEQNPDSGHDPTKLVVSGCSGCGKGAFLVGVFSRIPMTVIVESGGGGAANLRQAEWFRNGDGRSSWQCSGTPPQSIDNLEENGICGPWVTSVAQPLRSQPDLVNHLPFDQHLLLATMAPRYLVHFSNDNGTDSWCHLGGTCEALSAWAAAPVWNALGVPERMAFEIYSGNHCSAGDTGIAAAMFDRAFGGNANADTGGVFIQDSRLQQPQGEWEGMWIDWDMNTVLQ